MIISIDNNIFFSLMNPNSTASQIFEQTNLKFVAANFIKSEFNKYKSECLAKSGLSEPQFENRKNQIETKIKFYDVLFYKKFLKKAIKLISDPDDASYLALALAINCPIWSNDPHLKQQFLVEIYSTKDIIELLDFE